MADIWQKLDNTLFRLRICGQKKFKKQSIYISSRSSAVQIRMFFESLLNTSKYCNIWRAIQRYVHLISGLFWERRRILTKKPPFSVTGPCFIDVFGKLRKAILGSIMSICLTARPRGLHHFYTSPNIMRGIRMGWVEHVALMRETRGTYKVLVGGTCGERQ
jgi:hypothetical protein